MRTLMTVILLTTTLSLGACTQLSPTDRELLVNASDAAEEARAQAMIAVGEARMAREAAEQASVDARKASEKADRIYRQSQTK